jgi:hypothetical protein
MRIAMGRRTMSVSSHARKIGDLIASRRDVELVTTARVRDGPVFEVTLRIGGDGVIRTACTCTLHELGLVVCRHVWAAVAIAAKSASEGRFAAAECLHRRIPRRLR